MGGYLRHHQTEGRVRVGDDLLPGQQNVAPLPAGPHKVAPARHHRLHRLQLIVGLTAGIRTPGSKYVVGVQLRQPLGADVDALAVRDRLDQRRKAKARVAQRPAESVVAVVDGYLAAVGLDHRHADARRIQQRAELADLRPVAVIEHREARLRPGQIRQPLVNTRRAALQVIDADRRSDVLQPIGGHVAVRLGNDQVRLRRRDGLQVDIGAADELNIAVGEINAGQRGAGAQVVAAVRPGSPVAGDGRYPQFDQRNSNVEIVH